MRQEETNMKRGYVMFLYDFAHLLIFIVSEVPKIKYFLDTFQANTVYREGLRKCRYVLIRFLQRVARA